MLRLSRKLVFAPRLARCNTAAATSSASEQQAKEAARIIPGRSLQTPYFHPRTHDIPVLNIHFRSHHIRLLELYTHFATHAASSLGIPTSKTIYLPTQRTLWTVLRSPFVHKKSQENFERKVHKRCIKAWDADGEVVERWVKYLRVNAMGGVGMKVTRWERVPVGVGKERLGEVELVLGSEHGEQIRALGEEILAEEVSGKKTNAA